MKLSLVFLFLINSISSLALAQSQGLLPMTAKCVRADSGDSPELTIYSSDSEAWGKITLGDGSGDSSKTATVGAKVAATDVVHTLTGPISAVVQTQGEDEYTRAVNFTFDLTYLGLKEWLQQNTNLILPTNSSTMTVAFKCRN